jgi:hypothetical protein
VWATFDIKPEEIRQRSATTARQVAAWLAFEEGLIRQYLPKRLSLASLSQTECNAIARRLNDRPRERHGYATPLERLDELRAPPRL